MQTNRTRRIVGMTSTRQAPFGRPTDRESFVANGPRR